MAAFEAGLTRGEAEVDGNVAPVLSVIVPVFNQASSIVANIRTIEQRLTATMDQSFEVLVVSDGSIDATEDQLNASTESGGFRVFHYDRNLGKGYAVKLGALEARGAWIGFVDADLDLDPGGLAEFLSAAQDRQLDFAIGSKRHPSSSVSYPPSRVAASWLYQQLVRLLFRLDVRDTQVGLKVFSRQVADQVLPYLLVKRYAFDLELLAVARAFGFDRVEELPIQLDYRFAGSGVRSRAVARALLDTAAIFYRLRILRYYQRRRRFAGAFGWTRPRDFQPSVSVLLLDGALLRERDYPNLEVVEVEDPSTVAIRHAASRATGQILAVLEPGARAAGNWVSATAPFFARSEIVAVVTPKIAPLTGSLRSRAAAAVAESRLGGLVYFRYTPGNLRFVDAFPTGSFLVRREAFLALSPDVDREGVAVAMAETGARVLYTPESVIVLDPRPLFRPHLARVYQHGLDRGHQLRRGRIAASRAALGLGVILVFVGVCVAILLGGGRLDLVSGLLAAYAAAVALVAVAGAIRFQSVSVGALAAVGTVCTHVVYLAGAVRGLLRG